ncbi:DegT/DnrJ/EryC1/StrS family aminotransferase [Marinobacter nanhaiticus D15-8W]|uniref:DegT/DnrJ/EryC1/StrS family aminotransferase n=1 Tax=Marinobacter nanhaiticus D15-8W TaxID=626887 RepID=N6WQS3_9GAMM|nr:DegT/DnrJ/EryC1/StrS family aminotransferase [Marinobacter nanhaiticus]ENO13412.1 DegT/DnrJ/EryC1/StrS family aminotransferase [Marinobacter nanhaiticus D15-8W]BES70779.1 DegT/DnrJ/EryC1/StrS family aminotransferase [Marinobacter nanhaiticus D15-8W]
MIPVTKPYLPSREKLNRYLDDIYDSNVLTNNGPLVQTLTSRLEDFLEVENLLLVSNGTLALQIAYRALGINKLVDRKPAEAITTPFTFIATASSLKWDGIQPSFSDIDPESWCIAPESIEAQITLQTRAIIPVHVFGNACDVEAIGRIAHKYNLKVIYDASHAFGVKYKGESLLKQGDAATLSFHATKLFHTGEGGAIVFKRQEDLERARKMINFGITAPESMEEIGINAKMSELQAAMGLSVLDEMQDNLRARKKAWEGYYQKVPSHFTKQKINKNITYNYAYFPVMLKNQDEVKKLLLFLAEKNIFPRRYFYPSLESVKFLENEKPMPVSASVSSRILCLPLYFGCDFERVVDSIWRLY